LHELLVACDELRNLIQAHARTSELTSLAMKNGMVRLMQDGIQKVLRGLTTFKQVRTVAMK
jgi:type II secretory ATPase GspE/PulE/Tfp pilus assembly ATPase PilB-like protein